MLSDRQRQADKIFEEILDLPPAERESHLAKACGDDLDLRAEVESLLNNDELARQEGFLGTPPVNAAALVSSGKNSGLAVLLSPENAAGHQNGATELMGPSDGPPAPNRHQLRTDAIPGYELIRLVGRGGQGAVYEARQISTGRRVAIKILQGGPFASERARQSFDVEVRLLARLNHPNIVIVHESGSADGVDFFSMSYVEGTPLDSHVKSNKPPLRALVELFVIVCDAVGYAHRHGVIHRDLKPSNVLVDAEGAPYILDFGLAKLVRAAPEDSLKGVQTLSGQLKGTLIYMSPEQTRGEPDLLDTRTDVYSLGVILHELLTGKPLHGSTDDLGLLIQRIREEDPPRPSRLNARVNSELDAIVLRAMRKEAHLRYQTAGELADDLRAWLNGRPVTAKSDSALYVLRKLAARHYFHTSVIATLLAAIVGFGAISYHLQRRTHESEEHLQKINAEFATYITDLEGRLGQAAANTGQHLLGYFLLEWHAGRTEAAREIQRLIPRQSPEFAVTAFLLNDGVSEEDLRKTPQIGESLVLFAVGERYLKAGKPDKAREAFSQYARQYQGLFLPLVEARLQEIANHVER